MGSDLPRVAERILYHRAPVAIEHVLRRLERGRAGLKRAPICGVGVFQVKIEEHSGAGAKFVAAHHHDRIANTNVSRSMFLVVSGRAKCTLEKIDQCRRLLDEQPRRHRMPSLGNCFDRHCHSPCLRVTFWSGVAMYQMWPNGSCTPPQRSPHSLSSIGSTTFEPESRARLNAASASST